MSFTYCYIRQSKSRVDQKHTFEYQYAECYQTWETNRERWNMPPWAGRNDVFYDEDVSGRKTRFDDRAEAKRLLRTLRPGDHLIVWRIDRLGRRLFDIVSTVGNLIDRGGIKLHVANMHGEAMDLTSMAGKLILIGFAIAAEIEGEAISERNKASAAYLKRAGMPVNRFPPSGLGWRWEITGHAVSGKVIKVEVPDVEQRQNIQQIWLLRKQGVSAQRIAKRLNSAGRLSRHGGEWSRAMIEKAYDWICEQFKDRFGDDEQPSVENWPAQARALTDPELRQDPPKPEPGASIDDWEIVDGRPKLKKKEQRKSNQT